MVWRGQSRASSATLTPSTSRRWRSSASPAWPSSWRCSAASSWSALASGNDLATTSGPCSPPPSRQRRVCDGSGYRLDLGKTTVIPVAFLLLAAAVLRTSAGAPDAWVFRGGRASVQDRAGRCRTGLTRGDRSTDAGGARRAPEPGRRQSGPLDSALDAARGAGRFRTSPRLRASNAPWSSRPRETWTEPLPRRGMPRGRNRPTGASGSPFLGSRLNAGDRSEQSTRIGLPARSTLARPFSRAKVVPDPYWSFRCPILRKTESSIQTETCRT